MTVEQLIEDYERRIENCNKLLDSTDSNSQKNRLETKKSCYKTFISELKRIKDE
ncbi:hypothetical protein BPT24_048 [Tenacibaculum phage pT24]|uniref:Uncharacterized protein n=1 Tax=Tenacibaculum phage pT24 TaxID=1880590 RepID=A0A1B4XWI1_9CAUD|nr:hypothetical protein HYP10_gp048 [Tenacibaculum phage pT24]BAV39171.1 hypothetical protein BPT24_048 [Tenacibaculum phage pT24]